jgi:hypothetical protein
VLATARGEGRILITEDRDFGELVVRQRLAVSGIVLLELDRLSNTAEADRVAAIVSANTDKFAGNLVVMSLGEFAFARCRGERGASSSGVSDLFEFLQGAQLGGLRLIRVDLRPGRPRDLPDIDVAVAVNGEPMRREKPANSVPGGVSP